MNQPYIVPSTVRRDLLIGLAVGLAIMVIIVFGVMKMAGGIAGSTLNGKIVAKHFTPFEETQVTFGKGGVHQQDGNYVLECEAKGRLYLVAVDKETYNATKVGGCYLFPRPKE